MSAFSWSRPGTCRSTGRRCGQRAGVCVGEIVRRCCVGESAAAPSPSAAAPSPSTVAPSAHAVAPSVPCALEGREGGHGGGREGEGTEERQGAEEARALAKTETMSATVIMP
eukprot:CAMPEP_0185478818 /NCGR_PEP_ID=MMETSP1366-20130426/5028_1 /TAXON_ID=38817 /ORGANISM="Gephyrocapsa oceanica, Strain RCC1303" /LENGTH=111 /DNA_ID=CAMNT_0028086127 /DNA_START=8 /DNA_END=339 /DNA_ORIENTATION=+